MSDQAPALSTPIKRSPSYPGISLKAAVERTDALYAAEKMHAAPIETAVKHWGYKGPNGRTNTIVGALKKFGLIVDSGSGRARKIQVTEAGRRILEHPQPEERIVALQKAALLPRIHTEMWEKYGNQMPTDDTWVWELREDRDFTDVGAREFVKEYRETISFARLDELDEPDGVPDEVEDGEDLEDGDLNSAVGTGGFVTQDFDGFYRDFNRKRAANRQNTVEARGRAAAQQVLAVPQPLPNPALQTYSLPMGPGRPPVEIRGEFPLSQPEWDVLMKSLEIWKSMLVSDSTASAQNRVDDEDDDPIEPYDGD